MLFQTGVSPRAQPDHSVCPMGRASLLGEAACLWSHKHPLTSSGSCPQLLHPVDREPVHPSADRALLSLALAVALLRFGDGRRELVPAVALCSVRQPRVGVSPAGTNTGTVGSHLSPCRHMLLPPCSRRSRPWGQASHVPMLYRPQRPSNKTVILDQNNRKHIVSSHAMIERLGSSEIP